jgi:hypothetical protein
MTLAVATPWTFSDQTKVFHSANGMITEERLPDGTVFTRFDASGRPLAGVVADRTALLVRP